MSQIAINIYSTVTFITDIRNKHNLFIFIYIIYHHSITFKTNKINNVK